MIKKLCVLFSLLMVLLLILVIVATYFFAPYINGDIAIDTLDINQVRQEAIDNYKVRWIETDQSADPTIVFFHGAPGSWADFSDYLTDSSLVSKAHMVSMDRPGYGGTHYGNIAKTIKEQTDLYHAIVSATDTVKNLLLIGYSYGGPIAIDYAHRYPDQVAALILLAPVIAPKDEKMFWFNSVLDWTWIKWILPKYISAANDEKLIHQSQLQSMSSSINQIDIPTIHLHCMDDWIAPFKVNTDYIKSIIPSYQLDTVYWEGDSHFLPNHIKSNLLPIINAQISKIKYPDRISISKD